MFELDFSYEKAKELFPEFISTLPQVISEEDSKIQLINRLIIEVLGWPHQNIHAEIPNDNGFSDFLLKNGNKSAIIIEAKRQGKIQLKSSSDKMGFYKISGPALRGAISGIEQAASYTGSHGVQLAALTDGNIWIIFRTFISGGDYKEKEAIVFPSLEAVLNNFTMFFETLSKAAYGKNYYKAVFDKIHEKRLILKEKLNSPIVDSDIKPMQKSKLAWDLEEVFSSFFSRLAGDEDPDLVLNCFVETKESRIADFSLEKITENVLGNLSAPDGDVGADLHQLIENTVDGEKGRTVFIVGPTGAGKTTFLDRFFKKTLRKSVKEQCIILSVNALDASGDDTTSVTWLTEKLINRIETQLYADGFPNWDELMGLYHSDYVRRSKGVDAHLYNSDKAAFKIKFGEFMDEKVEKDREGYLERLLNDIVKNRKRLPIILVDNTDEFSLEYKERIFQYCQSVRRSVNHCILLFPVTDRSAWTFSKTDIFNIYRSQSFFLPTPSPREVFRKRVNYLQNKINATQGTQKDGDYFSQKGIRINISDIEGVASVIENVFVNQDYTSTRIGAISNYNIRKTLDLSKRVITSSELKIDDIIKSYITGENVTPTFSKFMRALLKGDFNYFKKNDDHYIFQLFQIDPEIRQSPLIHLRILRLLKALHDNHNEDVERYIEIGSIEQFFDAMGFSEIAIDKSIEQLMESDLIEPYDISQKDISTDQRVAITYSGISHVEMGLYNPIYFEQMALTTPCLDPEIAKEIRDIELSSRSYKEKSGLIVPMFATYLIEEDRRQCKIPSSDNFEDQKQLQDIISERWISKNKKKEAQTVEALSSPAQEVLEEQLPLMSEIEKHGVIEEAVIATVDQFYHRKGFGFVTIDNYGGSIFLHSATVEAAELEEVHDGDSLLCDLSRGEKGLHISKVHNVVVSEHDTNVLEGEVIRLFPDRGYGFAHIHDLNEDAFFHFTLLSDTEKELIQFGSKLNVTVNPNVGGAGAQVKKIISSDILRT